MASNIVPGNIDTGYPKAGQDNSSQGFRDNFTQIKTNFDEAKTEIEDLQSNKASLNGSSDFADNEVTRAKLKDTSETVFAHGKVVAERSILRTKLPNFTYPEFSKSTMKMKKRIYYNQH